MHFEGLPDDLPKEILDDITNDAIEHCKACHCTCDAHFDIEVVGLMLAGEEAGCLVAISVHHSSLCFSQGRDN